MHTAAAYAWMRSTIPVYRDGSPTNGSTSAHDTFSFINLSLDVSAKCLLGSSNHGSSRMRTRSLVGNLQRKPPDRIIDGIRQR